MSANLTSTTVSQAVRPTPNSTPSGDSTASRSVTQRQDLPADGQQVPPSKQKNQSVELSQVVEQINKHIQSFRRDLEFSVDQDSKRVVIKVRDADTGEVIRQIPPKQALDIAKNLSDSLGLIFQARA